LLLTTIIHGTWIKLMTTILLYYKTDLGEIRCSGMYWIDVAQDRDH
jgi:hypothetical protein